MNEMEFWDELAGYSDAELEVIAGDLERMAKLIRERISAADPRTGQVPGQTASMTDPPQAIYIWRTVLCLASMPGGVVDSFPHVKRGPHRN